MLYRLRIIIIIFFFRHCKNRHTGRNNITQQRIQLTSFKLTGRRSEDMKGNFLSEEFAEYPFDVTRPTARSLSVRFSPARVFLFYLFFFFHSHLVYKYIYIYIVHVVVYNIHKRARLLFFRAIFPRDLKKLEYGDRRRAHAYIYIYIDTHYIILFRLRRIDSSLQLPTLRKPSATHTRRLLP